MKGLIDGPIWKDGNGYLKHGNDYYVHRTVVEKAIGRSLKGKECVHHVDYDKANCSPYNLVLCPDTGYHRMLHARQRILDKGGHPDTHAYCSYHKCLHLREAFSTQPNKASGVHNMCRAGTNEYKKGKNYRYAFTWKQRLNQQYRRVIRGYTKRELCLLPSEEARL